MNWSKVKFIFIDGFVWLLAHWWILLVLAGFIGIALLYGQIQSCNANRNQKKLDKKREEIQQGQTNAATDETIANMQENRVKEKENIANEKSNISKNAEANFNAVVNRDSGEYDGDYERTKRKYCADADHKRERVCQSLR
jgi:hypothetical protein